jgi:hypothetical protein
MPEETPPAGPMIQVPVVWVGVDDLPVYHVNQFVATVSPTVVFLTLGTLAPPAILGGTDEERLAQVRSIDFVQIRPVVRTAMTEQGLRDLIRVLNQTLKNYENQQKAEGS